MAEEQDLNIAHDVAVDAPERTTEELDKLADDNQVATNRERAMTAPPKKEEVKPEFEFTHGGKKIAATREQLIKWAQQGYDYPQKAQKLNQQFQAWENEKKNWEIYRQIDDFAKKNPEWWQHIEGGWKNRSVPVALQQGGQSQPQGGNGVPPQGAGVPGVPQTQAVNPLLEELRKTVSEIVPAVHKWKEQQERQRVERADTELDQEIQSIRKAHTDLDWESLDQEGKSLELRVLEHAQKSGISTFRAAFRDLFHDELVKKAEAMAKVGVSQGIQQRTKLGVLGETPTPKTRTPRSSQDIRKTSYEDIADEIKQELRSGVYR